MNGGGRAGHSGGERSPRRCASRSAGCMGSDRYAGGTEIGSGSTLTTVAPFPRGAGDCVTISSICRALSSSMIPMPDGWVLDRTHMASSRFFAVAPKPSGSSRPALQRLIVILARGYGGRGRYRVPPIATMISIAIAALSLDRFAQCFRSLTFRDSRAKGRVKTITRLAQSQQRQAENQQIPRAHPPRPPPPSAWPFCRRFQNGA